MRLESTFTFQAAHCLHDHPGPCNRIHGHGYILTVAVRGEKDPRTGMVIDFFTLDAVVKAAVIDKLDHQFLNDILQPSTTENLVEWIWRELLPHLPGIVQIILREEPHHAVIYDGPA